MRQRVGIVLSAIATVLAIACSQSDPGITTAVKSKLTQDDTVKAYEIDVDTTDRVVTLSGTVETTAAKDQAIMIARQTEGVRDVVDRINVNPQAAATTGDLTEQTGEAARDAREEAREGIDATGDAADRSQGAMSDAAITTSVKTKFLADDRVAGLKIEVDTRDGVVTLSGTAATQAEVDRAVAVARDTDNVRSVVNNIRMGR
jgi:hyperosmotically inducible protein